MSEYVKAAERLEKYVRDWEHFKVAAEALKKVGNLDQVVRETEAKIATLREDVQKYTDLVGVSRKQAEEAQKAAGHILEAAAGEADNVIKGALRDAEEAKRKAEEDANGLLAEANSVKAAAMREAQDIRAQAAAQAKVEIGKADQAKADVAKAASDLAELETKMARAREEARRIMG